MRNLGWILKDKIFVACLFTNKQKLLNVGSGNNSLPQKLVVVECFPKTDDQNPLLLLTVQ